jgi:hypothetical protein
VRASWERTWERTVNQAGSVIECNWECPSEHARECAWELLESLLGSVQSCRLGVCHREQLGASLRACPGVYLGAS